VKFRELLVWVRLSCATALGAGCTGFACARFPVFPRVNFGMTRHRGRNGTRRVSSVVQRGERYCTTSQLPLRGPQFTENAGEREYWWVSVLQSKSIER
jgi:hypothetical protein